MIWSKKSPLNRPKQEAGGNMIFACPVVGERQETCGQARGLDQQGAEGDAPEGDGAQKDEGGEYEI